MVPTNGLSVSEVRALGVDQVIAGAWIVEVQQGKMSRAAAGALKSVTRQLLMAHVAPNGLMSRIWMEQLIRT
jgi:DNA repair protein RecO (recombination protein O)